MKTIGIIGASGFIGTSLRKLLDHSDYDVSCFDNRLSDESIMYLDVSQPFASIDLGHVDVLINLAAEHRDDVQPVSRYDSVNVEGARNVCQYVQINFDELRNIFVLKKN